MHYLQYLEQLHEIVQPSIYFEIGIRRGASLRLGRKTVIGVDPSYKIEHEISNDAHLFSQKSDDFFKGNALRDLLGNKGAIDLAFIDGWHNFEFALRDFMNTERHAHKNTVIAFDDVRPRTELEAARSPNGGAWTGDIWKVAVCLQKYRPDLRLTLVRTIPTGLLIVQKVDPRSRVLWESYDAIEREFIADDYPLMPSQKYFDSFVDPGCTLNTFRTERVAKLPEALPRKTGGL